MTSSGVIGSDGGAATDIACRAARVVGVRLVGVERREMMTMMF
jgi:hypothetical protein